MATINKQLILNDVLTEGREGYADFLRDKYKPEEISQKETLENARKLGKGDFAEEVVERKDTAVPVEKVEIDEKEGSDFEKVIELAEEFHMLQARAGDVERELAGVVAERKKYYNDGRAVGKKILVDHRLGYEGQLFALEDERETLSKKTKDLKFEIIELFGKITDLSEKRRIYEYFEKNDDELGLKDKILNFRTQDIVAKNQEKKAALAAWQKEAEESKTKPEPEIMPATESNLISGIKIGEGLDDKPEKIEPAVIPEAKADAVIEDKPATVGADLNAAKPEETAKTEPVKNNFTDFATFGPDGNAASNSTTKDFNEDVVPSDISSIDDLIGNKTSDTTATDQPKRFENDIADIKDRIGLPPTEKMPPLKDFGALDTTLDNQSKNSSTAEIEQKAPALKPEEVVVPLPVDKSTTEDITPAAVPPAEVPPNQPPATTAPAAVQNFEAPEPEKRGGFFDRLLRRGNKSTENNPMSRHDVVKNMASVHPDALTSAHLAGPEKVEAGKTE